MRAEGGIGIYREHKTHEGVATIQGCMVQLIYS
nr:MAG TPA: hypothetical protein [Siphoviridae sp. ctZCl11]